MSGKASRQQQWATAHPDLPSLAEKYSQLSEELDSLRALMRQPGVEPDDKTA